MNYSGAVFTVTLLALVFFSKNTARPDMYVKPSAVYEGTSPFAEKLRSFLNIPANDKCDRVKWKLSIFNDGNYELVREYGYHIDNRTFSKTGTSTITGKLELNKDVYTLYNGKQSISFKNFHNKLLHLLEPDKSLMIGDGGQSYTINRMDGRKGSSVSLKSTPAPLTTGAKDSISFVGRTPCNELSKELKLSPPDGWQKIKWRIRLYQDAKGNPTIYRMWRTFNRQSVIEGKWKMERGTKADPNAVVYIIDPDKALSLYLMKGDDNVLFFLNQERELLIGNVDFSYTLNREYK